MASISQAQQSSDPELTEVLAELRKCELTFHRSELGTSRADFETMIEPDFLEVGASGRRYCREDVLDQLERRFAETHSDEWETSEIQCRKLAHGLYLLTYTLLQDKSRLTRRVTIWRLTDEGWKVVFHQGTPVEGL